MFKNTYITSLLPLLKLGKQSITAIVKAIFCDSGITVDNKKMPILLLLAELKILSSFSH